MLRLIRHCNKVHLDKAFASLKTKPDGMKGPILTGGLIRRTSPYCGGICKTLPYNIPGLLPGNEPCIRRQYYSRKFPLPLSNQSVRHFVRGESSEFVITVLADIGVSQSEIEMDGIVGHADIMTNDKKIIELKDTVSGTRLHLHNDSFGTFK